MTLAAPVQNGTPDVRKSDAPLVWARKQGKRTKLLDAHAFLLEPRGRQDNGREASLEKLHPRQ